MPQGVGVQVPPLAFSNQPGTSEFLFFFLTRKGETHGGFRIWIFAPCSNHTMGRSRDRERPIIHMLVFRNQLDPPILRTTLRRVIRRDEISLPISVRDEPTRRNSLLH